MTATESITLGIAILGAVTGTIGIGLGIWSLYRELDRDRVKLKVVPNMAIPVGGRHSGYFLAVDVTNLSAFAVSIAQVSFRIRDSNETGISFEAITADGGPVQRRMEPRTSMSVLFPHELITDPTFGRVRCVFVKTACGQEFEGTSGALEQMAKEAQARIGRQ